MKFLTKNIVLLTLLFSSISAQTYSSESVISPAGVNAYMYDSMSGGGPMVGTLHAEVNGKKYFSFYNTTDYQLYMVIHDGTSWGTPSVIDGTSGSRLVFGLVGYYSGASIQVMPNNDILFFYTKRATTSGNYNLYYKKYSNNTLGSAVELTTGYKMGSDGHLITKSSGGDLIIQLRAYEGSNSRVQILYYDYSSTTFTLSDYLDDAGSTAFGSYNSMPLFLSNGDAVISYRQRESDNKYMTYYSKKAASGSTWTTPTAITASGKNTVDYGKEEDANGVLHFLIREQNTEYDMDLFSVSSSGITNVRLTSGSNDAYSGFMHKDDQNTIHLFTQERPSNKTQIQHSVVANGTASAATSITTDNTGQHNYVQRYGYSNFATSLNGKLYLGYARYNDNNKSQFAVKTWTSAGGWTAPTLITPADLQIIESSMFLQSVSASELMAIYVQYNASNKYVVTSQIFNGSAWGGTKEYTSTAYSTYEPVAIFNSGNVDIYSRSMRADNKTRVYHSSVSFGISMSSVAVANDNSTVAVTFTKPAYRTNGGSGDLEVSDFALSISGGTATLTGATPISITKSSNTYTLGIPLSGTASGSEVLTVKPANDTSIYDADGSAATVSDNTKTVNLKDLTKPTISGVVVPSTNATAAVTFSEAVYNTSGGSGALEVGDFALALSGGTATLSSATPSSIAINSNTYTLGLPLSGTANGSEVLTVVPVASQIFDASGNAAVVEQANTNSTNLTDKTAPFVETLTVAQDYKSILVTFSEAVFPDTSGSGNLAPAAFANYSISGGKAQLSSASVSTVTNNDTTQNNSYTIDLNLTGEVVGTEKLVVTIVPANIFDKYDNGYDTQKKEFILTLTDYVAPYIVSAGLGSEEKNILVVTNEDIFGASGQARAVDSLDFVVSVTGGVATLARSTPSSFKVINSTQFELGLAFNVYPNGSEVLSVSFAPDSVFDDANNSAGASPAKKEVTLKDVYPAEVAALTVAADNSTVNVKFTETIKGIGSTGALSPTAFSFTLTGGSAKLVSALPSSIFHEADSVSLGISLTGVANGSETLRLFVQANSVKDAAGNASVQDQTVNTVKLNTITVDTVIVDPVVPSDTLAPSAPTLVVGAGDDRQITIQWAASPAADLSHYNVYGDLSNTPQNLLAMIPKTSTTFTHTGLLNGETYYYKVTAVDSIGNESAASSVITMAPNAPPEFIGFSDSNLLEDEISYIKLFVQNIDKDSLSYSATTATQEVTLQLYTDSILVVPDDNWYGTGTIEAVVSDGKAHDTTNINFEVKAVNDAPVIASISSDSTTEDISTASVYMLSATDVEGDAVSFAASPDTSGIKVSLVDNELSIVPEPDYFGNASVTVFATDGVDTDSTSFVFTVLNTQDAPSEFEWMSLDTDTIDVTMGNSDLEYSLEWTESLDPDQETITYLVYLSVGRYGSRLVASVTDNAYTLSYAALSDTVFSKLPSIPRAQASFTVDATDGIDTVSVTGDQKVVVLDRGGFLSVENTGVPSQYALSDNYPNPFNPSTRIQFQLPQSATVNLVIYNMVGQEIKRFTMTNLNAGYHNVMWNATNNDGAPVSNGVYLYQLQTDQFVQTKKMVFMK